MFIKKIAKDRWNSEDGKEIFKSIIKCFSAGRPIQLLENKISKIDGRWDLCGINLAKEYKEIQSEIDGHKLPRDKGAFKFKNLTLDSIDFSHSNLSYVDFESCNISNCKFDGVKARNVEVRASNFFNCQFINSDLSYSFMNLNIGKDSGSYISNLFVKTNLSECSFCFPKIEQCEFKDCRFNATNFDGSRFKDCSFVGTIDSAWFRGYSLNAQKSILYFFNKVTPKNYPNLMKNINFSNAKLIGVSFTNGIDLSTCKFPDDENYLLIERPQETFEVLKYTTISWDEEYKRIGLHMINNYYRSPQFNEQQILFIDKFLLQEQFSKDFADFFFQKLS